MTLRFFSFLKTRIRSSSASESAVSKTDVSVYASLSGKNIMRQPPEQSGRTSTFSLPDCSGLPPVSVCTSSSILLSASLAFSLEEFSSSKVILNDASSSLESLARMQFSVVSIFIFMCEIRLFSDFVPFL